MLTAADLPTGQMLQYLLGQEPVTLHAPCIAVVCDTNLILDWFYWKNPQETPLLYQLKDSQLVCVRCEQTLLELADVIRRPQFSLTLSQQEKILQQWGELSRPVSITRNSPILCRDPNDQKFLDLAFSAKARFLLTKDKDLLRCARKTKAMHLAIGRPEILLTTSCSALLQRK